MKSGVEPHLGRQSADRTEVDLGLLARAPVGLFITDGQGRCTFVTNRLCEIVGKPAAALQGQHWHTAFTGHEVEIIEDQLGNVGLLSESVVIDLTTPSETGDEVTGVLSRASVFAYLAKEVAETREGVGPETLGLLVCALDRFSDIKDTLGSAAADELLRAVAGRLHARVRSCDKVGRLEPDQFVVITEQEGDARAIELVAERVLDLLDRPFRLHGSSAEVTGSIGVIVGDGTRTADHLLTRAAVAAEAARAAGGDCWRRGDGLRLLSREP
jgi:diguanylate cyclase (GGDEF)-like protein